MCKNQTGFWGRVLAGCLLLLGQIAPGYAFPDRPLTLVVPFPATGTADIYGVPRITKLLKVMQTLSTPSLTDSLALELGRLLTAALGQPVNFERHAKGRTLMGARYAARAKPDGYTLLLAGNPTITIYPSLYPNPPFDPLKDLAPVAALAGMPMALVTARANPAATVRQLIEHARFVPGQINYAVVGGGSTSHLTGELFRAMSGIDIMRVSYNGSTPALNAVVTHNVEFGFVPLTAVLPFLEGGKVRIVAITARERHPVVPQVPTIAESGVTGFDASGWFGVFAPARTSGAIISLLNYEINRALSEHLMQRSLVAQGLTSAVGTPEEFRALIEKDSARWARLLKNLAVSR